MDATLKHRRPEFSDPPEIMLIDDTPTNLQVLIQFLQDEGYQIRPSIDGAEALRSIQERTPDLILLDILMPGLSGYDVCKRLKADEATRDVPVIFLSAMTDTGEKLKAFEMGGVDYVTKPVQQQEVLARVRTHLALRRMQAQLQEENERFQRLEEATFEGVIIHSEGRILEVNHVICRLLGFSREQMEGQRVSAFIAPEYRERIATRFRDGDGSPYELELLKRDGARLPVEVYGKSLPWQGKPARVTAVRDLSERREWEQKTLALESENVSLRAGLKNLNHLGELVGKSPAMQKVYERLIQAAASQEIAMIYGETGSGKELAARTIFQLSEHHTACFVAVNCGGVPENLFEAQFFGARKGAFTGAVQNSAGFFEQAEGGDALSGRSRRIKSGDANQAVAGAE